MSVTSKADVVKELQQDNTIVHDTMSDWEITFDESSTRHQYEKISEAELSECVTAATLYEWKIQCMASFQTFQVAASLCAVTKKLLEDDNNDVEYDKVLANSGKLGVLNSFYILVSGDNNYYYKLEERPVGKCSYDSCTKQSYGIPNNFRSINEREIVSKAWLKSNFTAICTD